MSSQGTTGRRRSDFWVLCGVVIGLLLVLGRWWSLHAEGQELERIVEIAETEYRKLEPIVPEVKGLRDRQRSLESVIMDLVRRRRLFQVSAAALEAPSSDVVLESLEVHGLEVEIVAQADDNGAVQVFVDALEQSEGFRQVSVDDSPGDDPPPQRFVIRGELGSPGGEE